MWIGLLLALCALSTDFLVVGQGQQRSWANPFPRQRRFPVSSSAASSSGWGEWSAWTRCSRSCGGGVKEQRRHCQISRTPSNTSPAARENWGCEGSNKRYLPCARVRCPDGTVNTRRAQCANLNTKKFGGQTYIWEPMIGGGPCQLNCRARGHRFFVRHASRVTDGTDCSVVARGRNGRIRRGGKMERMCLDGRCVEIGCDGLIASGLTVDRCGVCGGEGASCEFVNGVYRTQTLTHNYHLVVSIPAGAKRINITEETNSGSLLALKRSGTDVMYLNGNIGSGIIDPNQRLDVAGTVFDYKRPFDVPKGETLFAEGPTTEALEVLLYFQRENPGIRYEYIVPKAVSPPREIPQLTRDNSRLDLPSEELPPNHATSYNHQLPSSRRIHSHFSSNQRFPGVGNAGNTPSYGSHRLPYGRPGYQSNGQRPLDTVDRIHPSWSRPRGVGNPEVDSESTTRRREANQVNWQRELDGATMWVRRGFGPCSQSCAQGVKRLIVVCLDEARRVIDDRFCTDPKPEVKYKACNKQACPPYYDVSEWSECTRTCGPGRRSRRVLCKQKFAGNFTTAVFHKKCRRLPKPATHEQCIVQDCARWEVDGEWSQCSSQCGTGTQSRKVVCKAGSGETLPATACTSARRPSLARPCDAGPCLTEWLMTEWDSCSADCDRGVQRRHVHCLNTAGSKSGCPAHSRPNATRTCARSSCSVKHEWFSGKWSPCSSKCGAGTQDRSVVCLSVSPDGSTVPAELVNGRLPCDPSEKPPVQQTCNTQSCGSRWYHTHWTECTVSCGGGSRTRDVQCLDEEGRYSSLCNIDERPKHAERCNTASCIALQDPSCSDRLSKCQLILQARLCTYSYYRAMCCLTCSLPRTRRSVGE